MGNVIMDLKNFIAYLLLRFYICWDWWKVKRINTKPKIQEVGFNFRTSDWDFSKAKPLFLYKNKGVQRFHAFGHLKVKIMKLE